jgi:hypothetical protein
MFAGDTYPAMRGEASDETGVLDLSTAVALEFMADSSAGTIHGTATAIHPPIADADGVHQWNWQYAWAAGDTANVGTYEVYLKVTWSSGPPAEVETFGPDTLEIIAAPT